MSLPIRTDTGVMRLTGFDNRLGSFGCEKLEWRLLLADWAKATSAEFVFGNCPGRDHSAELTRISD
jgi:hypothetical protein